MLVFTALTRKKKNMIGLKTLLDFTPIRVCLNDKLALIYAKKWIPHAVKILFRVAKAQENRSAIPHTRRIFNGHGIDKYNHNSGYEHY